MRIIGYIFLIGGFLFLAGEAAMSEQFACAVILKQSIALPKQDTFTRKQMDEERNTAAFGVSRLVSAMAIPAIVMLCGGILLDRARRE